MFPCARTALLLAALSGCASFEPIGALAPTPHGGGPAAIATPVRWQRVGVMPKERAQICDLAASPWGLVVAASRDALGEDGATIALYNGRLTTLLDWDGQGFLRAHLFGGRLVIPDADAPFHLLPFIFDLDVDGYVFVSDAGGALALRRRAVLPRVYHVFDVAQLADGRLVASTGAYPPDDVAYFSDFAPAALFVSGAPGEPWKRVLELPDPRPLGVHRLVYLHALADGALLASDESGSAVRIEELKRVTVVEGLTGFVLRWTGRGDAVYAIVQTSRGTSLIVSHDLGRSFAPVPGAPDSPQSLATAGDTLFLLADGALWTSTNGAGFRRAIPTAPALRHEPSTLVSAPLTVHDGAVWAASPRTGEIFRGLAD